jgi:hypothetical protein
MAPLIEPVIPAVERLETNSLDHTATGTDSDEVVVQWFGSVGCPKWEIIGEFTDNSVL